MGVKDVPAAKSYMPDNPEYICNKESGGYKNCFEGLSIEDIKKILNDSPGIIKPICEHKFVHLETTKTRAVDGGYCGIDIDWRRVDRFFCEKCLEIVEKVTGAPADVPKPDWF